MDIQINYDYRKEDLEKLPLHELTQFVLAREDKPFNTEVSISFVTDEAIAELNERYRHKEGPTDVLSFECDGVDDDLSAMTLAGDPVYELGPRRGQPPDARVRHHVRGGDQLAARPWPSAPVRLRSHRR